VELAHLDHLDKQYEQALAQCDAALAVQPGYAPAHRQRGATLLALGRYREAGQALDACLAAADGPTADVLVARGLVYLELGQRAEAVEAFTRALERQRDADTLAYRGWAYLEQQAARPALADFAAALKQQPDHVDALSGRGMARALLGQTTAAVEDAEAALTRGPRSARLLFRCACIHARCLGVLVEARRPGWESEGYRRQERALELLRAALTLTPEADRTGYWRHDCQNNPDLVPLRRSSGWLELARQYGK
jgi:tetratricopeptide (TPR) repeat protein